MTPEDRKFWLGFALGGVVFALAMGWAMEFRAHRATAGMYDRALTVSLADQLVLSEALKIGVPDTLTRALVGAQAVRNTGEKAKAAAR